MCETLQYKGVGMFNVWMNEWAIIKNLLKCQPDPHTD
jgi:hypothetical protein